MGTGSLGLFSCLKLPQICRDNVSELGQVQKLRTRLILCDYNLSAQNVTRAGLKKPVRHVADIQIFKVGCRDLFSITEWLAEPGHHGGTRWWVGMRLLTPSANLYQGRDNRLEGHGWEVVYGASAGRWLSMRQNGATARRAMSEENASRSRKVKVCNEKINNESDW